MSKPLTITAKIIAKEGQNILVKNELLKLIETTRLEEGCINYDLHEDNENPNLFFFYENWTTRELWQKHMQNMQLANFSKATENAIEKVILNEMTPIS